MRLVAKTRTVLGLPRKRVTRPLVKGEQPVVADVVPFEKLVATASVSGDMLDRVYAEIDGPALPTTAFLFRHQLLQTGNGGKSLNPMAELRRLRRAGSVPRIEEVNEVLEQLVQLDPQMALQIVPKLESDFGVRPNVRTEALVAEIAVKQAKPTEALMLLDKRDGFLSPKEEILFGELVVKLLKAGNLEDGVKLYERYVQKVVTPAPFVVSSCIVALAKQSFVERAFRVYKEARERKQMSLNVVCQSALLFAAAKRKEYYREAVDSFRQLVALNMSVDPFDYANLMMAAGKVGDMETALHIWQRSVQLNAHHNPHLLTNLFYAFASTEGEQTKLSLRLYCTSLTSLDIVAAAKEIYDALPDTVLTDRIKAAYFACLCVHGDAESAGKLFFDPNPKNQLCSHESSVENFMRLCDTVHNVDLLERAISLVQQHSTLRMTKMTYRAIVRTLAYCHKYEEALQWIVKMKAQGHVADGKDLSIVERRLTQLDLHDLKSRYLKLVEGKIRPPFGRPPWRERSIRLAENLETAYGPNAPKLSTTY